MVAARSPSPNSSIPSNPNPNTLRKSWTFNLSKSCSGSEIRQRNLSSKLTSEKENRRDRNCSKPARTRSQAVNTSKGIRSFMAPTISASSKITAASPRKKILEERNQVVRDNLENIIVSSDGVEGEDIWQRKEIDFDSEEISGRSRTRKLDFSSSRDHHQSAATHSLDADDLDPDRSLPPYDPMKNYLSPRPRFLHYKPSPRIEQHYEIMEDLLYVGEGRRLEDSFSDSEGSEDCSGYDAPFLPLKEPEDDNENHVCESKPKHETYKPKAKWLGSFKLMSVLLILSVLLFSAPLTDSPIFSHFNMKYQSLAGPFTILFGVLQDIHLCDYADVAGRNLQGLATRMKQWSINNIETLMSSGSFSKEELEMSHSFNTTLSSSIAESEYLNFCTSSELEFAEKVYINNGQNDIVDDMEMEFEFAKTDSAALPENDEDIVKIDFSEDVNGDSTELVEWKMEEDNTSKYEQLNSFTDPADQSETLDKSDQLEKIGIAKSEEVNIAEKLEKQVLKGLGEDRIGPINKEDINSSNCPVDETQITNRKGFDVVPYVFSETKLLMLVVFGICASAALGAKLISLFIKQNEIIPSSDDKPPIEKTSVSGGIKSCKHANGDFHCNREGLAEMVCDSGPTEMSSNFNNNLFLNKQRSNIESHDVTPSHEIMQRRESGVSSSISYGSFTSFERRSRKGNKQGEVITPVRRSNRIRNHVSFS